MFLWHTILVGTIYIITCECISSLEAVSIRKHSFQEECDALSHTDAHCSWVLLWTSTKECKGSLCVYSNNGEMLFTKNPKTKAGEVAQRLDTLCPSRGLGVLFPALTLYSGFQGL